MTNNFVLWFIKRLFLGSSKFVLFYSRINLSMASASVILFHPKVALSHTKWVFKCFSGVFISSFGVVMKKSVYFGKMTRTIYQPKEKMENRRWKELWVHINRWWKFINLGSDTIMKRHKYSQNRFWKICHFHHFA